MQPKVFVGGLRESEDAVHITEEELATYFSKFGVIESVSINRDDRTHRGRGFAFVKFFQEVRASVRVCDIDFVCTMTLSRSDGERVMESNYYLEIGSIILSAVACE